MRDYVLGKTATDIDIATSAEPEEVKAVFPMTVDIGTSTWNGPCADERGTN